MIRKATWLMLAVGLLSSRPALRADGFFRRMGAGAGRRQHRQPVRRRVPRHSDEPGRRRSARRRGTRRSTRCRNGSAGRTARCTSRAGPSQVRIWKEIDPISRQITAYHAEWLRSVDNPYYMDGRARPPALAPHTWGGFSTAEFVGDMLKISTTHLKEDYYRRNGVPSSDRGDADAVLDPPRRHPDMGDDRVRPAVSGRADDSQQRISVVAEPADPAVPVHAGRGDRSAERRRAALPARTESVSRGVRQKYRLPTEVTLGGPATMYPEAARKLERQVERVSEMTTINAEPPSTQREFFCKKVLRALCGSALIVVIRVAVARAAVARSKRSRSAATST